MRTHFIVVLDDSSQLFPATPVPRVRLCRSDERLRRLWSPVHPRQNHALANARGPVRIRGTDERARSDSRTENNGTYRNNKNGSVSFCSNASRFTSSGLTAAVSCSLDPVDAGLLGYPSFSEIDNKPTRFRLPSILGLPITCLQRVKSTSTHGTKKRLTKKRQYIDKNLALGPLHPRNR